MSRKRQPRGYRVHGLDSPKGQAELTRQGLTKADLARALAAFEQAEQARIGTVIGITGDGVFGSDRDGWEPTQPDAFAKPLIAIPCVQILELLGRLPAGTTGRLLERKTQSD